MEKKLKKIFKAYDVRGIYPEEVDREIALKSGRAFISFLKKKRDSGKLKIVLARDGRKSSPELAEAVKRGILEAGSDVIDIGLSPTPMFYFAVNFLGADGGITVTSSHNPPQYNGFKFVRGKGIPISGETGLEEIRELVLEDENIQTKEKGEVIEKQVLSDYADSIIDGFDFSDFPDFKIVIDTANSVAGVVVPEIFQSTPFSFHHLFPKIDGSFPHHQPDPLKEENLAAIKEEVLKRESDLGIAFDGDGDRIVFVTEKGEAIRGDIAIALLAPIILRNNPGAKIMYDITASKIVRETIQNHGGIPLESRRGHSLIKERMRREDIFFAGEFSGHYFCQENNFFECPFSVLFLILEEMKREQKPLSELAAKYQRYYHSGEINFEVKDKQKVLQASEKKFSEQGEISKIDGIKVNFDGWWFCVRPSNTEPVVRLILEAETKELLEEKREMLVSFIQGVGGSD